MTSVLLIYPFFKPAHDRSVFRFPPLGVAYIASTLKKEGYTVQLIDCTFLEKKSALKQAIAVKAEVVGIYSMVTMSEDAMEFARKLRSQTKLLIAGGPLPTCDPLPFLEIFDIVVSGEGEQTILKLLQAYQMGADFISVPGIVFRKTLPVIAGEQLPVITTKARLFEKNLDGIPFPDRDLVPNNEYQEHGRRKSGYAITTIMSTRGCPFRCEFCSNVIFGGSYRERSAKNVVDEIEQVLGLGYDRISFADDVFTLNKKRVLQICDEIQHRKLRFQWECLGRVDSLDKETAEAMKSAGCFRIYFGIESGNQRILDIMHKQITIQQARDAVTTAHQAGMEVGAFFIIGYPGDTTDTILESIHFGTSLPVDYLGLTLPYPLPGTPLFERVKASVRREWHPKENVFSTHTLIFNAGFSPFKLQFGIFKGKMQLLLKKKLGEHSRVLSGFEKTTDWVFRFLK
jgi:anaerobic magnesium-protoporphyrin IX monomethyl ester cyclase